jgi:DNA-directed RNA polymerase subunit RPC12/RpoP
LIHGLPSNLKPHCPRCHSRNLVSLSKKTLVGASVGAGIGGFLSWLGTRNDTLSIESQDIPVILTGVVSGAIAGVALTCEEEDGSLIQRYLCLNCFHRFTWIRGSLN